MGSFKKKFFVICMDPGYGQCFEMNLMRYKETLDCTLKLNVVSKVNCIKLYYTICAIMSRGGSKIGYLLTFIEKLFMTKGLRFEIILFRVKVNLPLC